MALYKSTQVKFQLFCSAEIEEKSLEVLLKKIVPNQIDTHSFFKNKQVVIYSTEIF